MKYDYNYTMIENNNSFTLTFEEYLAYTHDIRKAYRSLGYSIRKGIVYKNSRIYNRFVIFPLSADGIIEHNSIVFETVKYSPIVLYFDDQNKQVTFKHIYLDKGGYTPTPYTSTLSRIDRKEIRRINKKIVNEKYKFKPSSHDLRCLLEVLFNNLKKQIPIVLSPSIVGWTNKMGKYEFEPIQNRNAPKKIKLNFTNIEIQWFLNEFSKGSKECIQQTLSLKFSPTDVIFLSCTLFALTRSFYNKVDEQPNFMIYVVANKSAVSTYHNISFWCNLFCGNTIAAFSDSIKRTYHVNYTEISQIDFDKYRDNVVIISDFAKKHKSRNKQRPKKNNKITYRKKVLKPEEIYMLTSALALPIAIRPTYSDFIPPKKRTLTIEHQGSCIDSDAVDERIDIAKLDLMNLYSVYIDMLKEKADLKKLNVYNHYNRAYKKLRKTRYDDESDITHYSYLLSSIYIFKSIMKDYLSESENVLLSQFSNMAEATIISCLSSAPKVECDSNQYIQQFRDFVNDLLKNNKIGIIGLEGSESFIGWIEIGRDQPILYLDYDKYYSGFSRYLANSNIEAPKQSNLERRILGPCDLLYTQYDSKGDPKKLRYDVHKVILRGEPSVKTIKIKMDKLNFIRNDR